MIPGQNILNMALRVIARQTFQYIPYASRTLQPNALYLTTYKAPINCTGSAQPFPRNLYQVNGLDFNKEYFTFFIARSILDVTRDVAGDQFILNCRRFQALSKTPWAAIDGWDAVLAVEVPTP